jgi:phage FluMu gp28-like protein
MLGVVYDGVMLPVASMTKEQARWGPIAWGKWLIDTARPLHGYRITRDPTVQREIVFPDTGSRIFTIPGYNPNSLRTYRSISVFYDEFDWCEQPKALLDAGQSCLSEGGQASIISTIQSRHGEFARLITHADALGYWVHRTPTWPATIDVTRPLTAQNVQPIAPWIDIRGQEQQRARDRTAFLRESMCEAPDADTQFLTWDLIQTACHLTYEQDRGERWRKRGRDAEHLYTIGWDFARFRDLSVCEVVEHTKTGIIQVYERVLQGVDTPTQNQILDQVVAAFHPDVIRIDRTGVGLGLYEYAARAHGRRVHGIDFASKMPTGQWDHGKKVLAPTRDLYAVNVRTLLQDHQLHLFDDAALKADLHLIPYNLTTPRRTAEGSHGDRFWALALAVYPARPYREITASTAMRPEIRKQMRARRFSQYHVRRW